MAAKKGLSGPPGNANAVRHGLAAVQRRRSEGALTPDEQDIRADILAGLIADKGGEQQIGTAERILAEIISSDGALMVTSNQAIDGVITIGRGHLQAYGSPVDPNMLRTSSAAWSEIRSRFLSTNRKISSENYAAKNGPAGANRPKRATLIWLLEIANG
jgi:hypothetical protein